jgi:hypothetical protein
MPKVCKKKLAGGYVDPLALPPFSRLYKNSSNKKSNKKSSGKKSLTEKSSGKKSLNKKSSGKKSLNKKSKKSSNKKSEAKKAPYARLYKKFSNNKSNSKVRRNKAPVFVQEENYEVPQTVELPQVGPKNRVTGFPISGQKTKSGRVVNNPVVQRNGSLKTFTKEKK